MKYSAIALLILGLFLVGCLGESKPVITSQWDKTSIDVNNGNYSSDFVKVTLTRDDNTPIPTTAMLKFHNKPNIYAVNEFGQRIETLPSKLLTGQGMQDILQFKVFGSSTTATGSDVLIVDVEVNGTVTKSQTISVNVK